MHAATVWCVSTGLQCSGEAVLAQGVGGGHWGALGTGVAWQQGQGKRGFTEAQLFGKASFILPGDIPSSGLGKEVFP